MLGSIHVLRLTLVALSANDTYIIYGTVGLKLAIVVKVQDSVGSLGCLKSSRSPTRSEVILPTKI